MSHDVHILFLSPGIVQGEPYCIQEYSVWIKECTAKFLGLMTPYNQGQKSKKRTLQANDNSSKKKERSKLYHE